MRAVAEIGPGSALQSHLRCLAADVPSAAGSLTSARLGQGLHSAAGSRSNRTSDCRRRDEPGLSPWDLLEQQIAYTSLLEDLGDLILECGQDRRVELRALLHLRRR